ncbi:MAG: O-antigen ligase family protein [Rhizobium sp.]|nr:O-antigen ligase family protein [Rhizobium sp.]
MLQSNGNSIWPAPPYGRTGRESGAHRSLWGSMGEKAEFALAMLAVATSPMNFLRTNQLYFTLSDAVICVCLVLLIRRRAITFQPLGKTATFYWMLGLSLMLGGLVLSSIMHGDPLRGVVYAVQYFFAYFVLLLVIAGRSEQQLLILAKIYVLVVAIMCLHGAYVINIDGQRDTPFVSGNGRLTGFVERENECAAVIALATPILLYLCADRRIPRLALLALPLFAYGVMLTGSNTGLGAFALSAAIFSALTLRWKRLLPTATATIVVIAAALSSGRDYLPALFQQRVLGALESGDLAQAGTFDHRVDLIREAIGRADSTVLFGLGADQFALTSAVAQPVHNLYLLLWTEGGLACMIGFVLMIAAGYGPAISAYRRPQGKVVAACAISIITIFLLSLNAFPSVYGRFWSMPVVLVIALAYASLLRSAPATHGALLRPGPHWAGAGRRPMGPDLHGSGPAARSRP